MNLLLDIDGVFGDFTGAALKLYDLNIDFMDVPGDIAKFLFPDDPVRFWDRIDFNFWRNIPWTEEGPEFYRILLNMFPIDNICVVTAFPEINGKYLTRTGYADGRIEWIQEHMPEIRHISLTRAKHFKAKGGSLLIDDNDENCELFLKAGGMTFTPSRPWNQYRGGPTFDVKRAITTIENMVANYRGSKKI